MAVTAADQDLLYEVREGIAYVTFNRPQARNALTFAMYERLAEICAAVNEDRTIRAMLLTGAGEKAFAAGTDISQFRAFDKPQDALDYEARIDRVLGALERCRVPTVAAVQGACTGGGAGIAVCCDLRIAAGNARFGFPVARTLGNCLSSGNYARLAALQPALDSWLKRKPGDVEFRRIPVVFQDAMLPFARIYYTLEAMGLLDKLHHDVFDAFHNQRVRLQEPQVLFDWAASKGVDRKKFTDAYNSFSVQSLTRRAAELTRRYGISFTPAVVVDGRLLTAPSMTSKGGLCRRWVSE